MRVDFVNWSACRFDPSKLIGLAAALMIAASVAGCAGGFGDSIASAEGLFVGAPKGPSLPVPMFVVSTRRDKAHPAIVDKDGAHFTFDIVSVPAGHRPGIIETPTFGKPQPGRHFVLTSERTLNPDEFSNQVATSISGRIGSNRDILLYVHGFNTSLQDARFRLAQIVADARFGGVPVLFTWPSQNNVFSYLSDKDRAAVSRDALEKLLSDLSHVPGIGRIHVLAHSMGTWLAMEALRENAIAGHPDLDGKLGDIMLAAPDIDIAVFRQQMARLGENTHVSIFVSAGDRALSLSSQITGNGPRVGALDPHNPRDRAELKKLGVRVYDLSPYSDGFIDHNAYADLPLVVRTIGAHLAEPRKEDAKVMAVTDAGADRQSEENAPAPGSTPSIITAPLPPPQSASPVDGQQAPM